MKRLAVVGSRTFTNYSLLSEILDNLALLEFDTIISGGAQGADKLGARYAEENGFFLEEYLPDWNKYGKSAGPIRNKKIVEEADIVICFWDGESKGTLSTIELAKQAKKHTIIVYF